MAPSPAAEMVEEAEGLRLHLSSKSSTGYKCVAYMRNSKSKPYHLAPCTGVHGTFATAVEAAVCYARHVLSQQEAAAQGAGVGSEAEVEVEDTAAEREEEEEERDQAEEQEKEEGEEAEEEEEEEEVVVVVGR